MDRSLFLSALGIGLGGAVGAIGRWLITLGLAPLGWPVVAGTLVVNLLGGLLIGASLVWFGKYPNDLLRLTLVTGLLGGLTTFSAFSAESLTLLLKGQWPLALMHSLMHLLGALASAALGWWLARQLLA